MSIFVGRLRLLCQAALTQGTDSTPHIPKETKQLTATCTSYQIRSRQNLTKSVLYVRRFKVQRNYRPPCLIGKSQNSSPLGVRWRFTMGSTGLATVVTQVNLIGSLKHANRFIFPNKGSFWKYKHSALKQGPYVLYRLTGVDSGAAIFITLLVFQSCYIKRSSAI